MSTRHAPSATARTPATLAACLALWLPLAFAPVRADTPSPSDTRQAQHVAQAVTTNAPTPLDEFELDLSYVGQSAFTTKRFDGAGASTQQPFRSVSEDQLEVAYTRRVHLAGNVYLTPGVEYERFDFSATTAPIPTSLQKLGGVLGVEYIQDGHTGAYFHVRPGVYYSNFNQIDTGNFDVPIDLGIILPVFKNVYALVGARTSLLAKFPVDPILGLVVVFNKHLRIEAVPPEPRLIYSYSEQLDFFIGAEILGDAYKRDATPDARPQDRRFSSGVISYSENRIGGGVTITPIKPVDIDLVGGWSLGSDFDYYRGGGSKRFTTEGAPYAKVSVSVEF